MATLTFNGNSYTVDHAVKGANYIHGYDVDGTCVVALDGVTDFSGITYNGSYMAPENCLEENYNDLKYCGGSITTRDGRDVPPQAIGAAPAGYGLGERPEAIKISSLDELDAAKYKYTGWYYFQSDTTLTLNSLVLQPRLMLRVEAIDTMYVWQTLYVIRENYMLRRLCEDNKWGEWEWVNPLMNPGVEYRTTDRIGTKSVYKKRDSSGKVMYRLDGEDTWNEYYPMVGAAPAGYGLGVAGAKYTSDINTCVHNGWYYTNTATLNIPHVYFEEASVFVMGRTSQYIAQQLTSIYTNSIMMRYTSDGGVTWVEEWVNPPMVTGTEYRTTERWNGKPVYKQTISLGKLPESTTKFENLLIADEVVDFSFTTTDNTSEKFIHNNKVTALGRAWSSEYIYATIESNAVLSQYYGYLTISYTKL